MSINTLKKNLKNIPFFIVVLGSDDFKSITKSNILILRTVPTNMSYSKDINYNEIQIPGGHTALKKFGSFGPKTLNFSFKIVNINDINGVLPQLSIIQKLEKPKKNLFTYSSNFNLDLPAKPFVSNPTMILWHSTIHTVPMEYYCMGVSYTVSRPNKLGRPQVAEVSIKASLNEFGKLYKIESEAQDAMSMLGLLKNIRDITVTKSHPYKTGRGKLI